MLQDQPIMEKGREPAIQRSRLVQVAAHFMAVVGAMVRPVARVAVLRLAVTPMGTLNLLPFSWALGEALVAVLGKQAIRVVMVATAVIVSPIITGAMKFMVWEM